MSPCKCRCKRKKLAAIGLSQDAINKLHDWELGPKLGQLYAAIRTLLSPQPTSCHSGATGITPGQATPTGKIDAYPTHSIGPLPTGAAAGAGV